MIKVEKQKSMNINGGHFVTAWPDTNYDASRPGVTLWKCYCPNQKHTETHNFQHNSYAYNRGTGRTYACRITSCNK